MPKFKMPDAPPHVVDQLIGKSWSDIEVLEHAGSLLFPDQIFSRGKDGKFAAHDVMLRVPKERDHRHARIKARELALKDHMDLDRDADLVDNLERICLLSVVIRSAVPPMHEPHETDPLALESRYESTSLAQVWSKVDKLSQLLDPAPETISEGEFIALISVLSKERHLGPLAVYGSGAQTSFILTMVDRLKNSAASKSSPVPSAPSTAEHSA